MAVGDVTTNINTPNARKCAVFDGINDYVDCGNDDSLNNGFDNGITLGVWFKLDKLSNEDYKPYILGKGQALGNPESQGAYTLSFGYGRLFFDLGSGSVREAVVLPSDWGWKKNTWYHVTATWNGTAGQDTIKVYVNGNLEGQGTSEISSLRTDSPSFRIGHHNTEPFNGSISDVRIYNRALSASEVEDLYNGKNITDGLISRWKLDYDYNDSVGSNDGTNEGSYLSAVEDEISADVSSARTGANDRIRVFPLGNTGKVMNVNIEEA